MHDALSAQGVYEIECRDSSGRLKWTTTTPNLVMLQGANFMLDVAFSLSPSGPSYAGLITASNFGSVRMTDTLTSKTWSESICSDARPLIVWSPSANGKKIASSLRFPVTAPDTVVGSFIVYGNASPSIGSTAGSLWSASQFRNGSQDVVPGDTLAIQYVTSLIRTTLNNFVVSRVEQGRAIAVSSIPAASPDYFVIEHTNATFTIIAVTAYHLSSNEQGSADSTQTGVVNFANFANEFDRFASSTQTSLLAFVGTIAEGSSTANSAQDYTYFRAGHDFFDSVAESGTAAVSTTVGITTTVAVSTTASDNTFIEPIYLVDDNGNFVVDDNGNRVIMDNTGP